MKKTICVDLDGTIIDYKQGWKGSSYFGEIVPGAKEALKDLKSKGWDIIIFTTRGENEEVEKFLKRNDLIFDYINENPDNPEGTGEIKPYADIYIDDKAINFDGDWSKALSKIYSFSRWEEKDLKKNSSDEDYVRFLDRDYSQCFEQMRHYDSLEASFLKFAFGGFTSIIAASWALFGYSKGAGFNPSGFLGLLLFAGAIFEAILLTLAIRTRIYFVNIARYINEHRNFFLRAKPLGFENITKMYTNYNFPQYFNPSSSYSIIFYLLSLGISVLFTAAVYFVHSYYKFIISSALLLIIFLLLLFVIVGGVILYLYKKEKEKQKGIDFVTFGSKVDGHPK